MALKSFSSGSKGAIQPASAPATNMISTIARPKVPSGWRRTNSRALRSRERLRLPFSSMKPPAAARLGAAMVIPADPSREADAWVEPGVEQVDHEIGDDENHDDQHGQGLGEHVVLV